MITKYTIAFLFFQLCSLKYYHKLPFGPFWIDLIVLIYVSVSHFVCVSCVSSHYSNVSFEFHSCKIQIIPQCNNFFIRTKKLTRDWALLFFQSLTNLIFACTDFHAQKIVLRIRSCIQNYVCMKESLWVLIYIFQF